MLRRVRTAAHRVGRHAFPAAAATVIVLGAAGGGIGYAVASRHSTAAPVSSTSASTGATTPVGSATPKHATPAMRGAQVIERVLSLLAAQTGQSVAWVRSQLEAGKSVNDIAGAKAPAIESAILAQINKLAARAVSAGRITAAQETAGLAMAKTKVEALMAEPGTQLLKDAQKFLQFLQTHGAARHLAVTPTPTPAA
ncbi:MAG: hypothetical protein JF886_07595 [Candidatus Dormibacteraeota bacterium]|uniref:Uncharacterized protein n=1 Tax=Candidatus Aeolococcus gillhamiae TaxID=3127015 RepID=A0A934N9Y2_9BACT|nr:hypothetical protein [Candidatus Dormibacteraeota bacterium]